MSGIQGGGGGGGRNSAQGGDWKDLLKAAKNGDIGLAKYHLYQGGVDSNFQHPEYFTAPIFEAIRNNHLDMVKLLIEGDVENKDEQQQSSSSKPTTSLTNPQLIEEMTDMTPIEIAIKYERYDIVQYLNTQLPLDAQWKPKHVLVTGGNRGIGKSIVELLLRQQHIVAFTCRSKEIGEQVKKELINKRGTKKIIIDIKI